MLALTHASFNRITVHVDMDQLAAYCGEYFPSTDPADVLAVAEKMIRSAVMLWAGHYDVCPWDAWRHALLCEAAAIGAFDSARISPSQWPRAIEIAAFFERNVVASFLTRREGREFAEGVLWEQLLYVYPQSLLTVLFFRVQSLLAPGSWNEPMRQAQFSFQPLADTLAPEVAEIIFDVKLRPVGGRMRVRGSVRHPASCADWSTRVSRLARLLVPYLGERQGGAFPSPFPPFGARSSGTRRLRDLVWLSSPEGTRFADSLREATRLLRSIRAGSGTNRILRAREATQYHRASFEELDRYYSERARALAVESEFGEGTARKPELYPIGFLDSERCSLAALASEQIDWSRTRSTGRTEGDGPRIQLFSRSEPLEIPLDGDEPPERGIPHLLLIVDSSGSMGFEPRLPRTVRGEYNVVLMACYGIFKHIESAGLGADVQVACINFSRSSIFSDWHPFSEIAQVKRVLLAHQNGGTHLSAAAIRRAFETRPGRFLAIVITDGCISDVAAAEAELRELVNNDCELALLHIGEANDFTRAVQAMNCPVHVLRSVEGLESLTLQVARDAYTRAGRIATCW